MGGRQSAEVQSESSSEAGSVASPTDAAAGSPNNVSPSPAFERFPAVAAASTSSAPPERLRPSARSLATILERRRRGLEVDLNSVGTDVTNLSMLDRLLRLPASHPFLQLASMGYFDLKCPVCNKIIPSDDVEMHLVLCLTRPTLSYNDDMLSEDKGECVICLEDLRAGDAIARLPCLCVYHKSCLDAWFKVKNCCPEHPD